MFPKKLLSIENDSTSKKGMIFDQTLTKKNSNNCPFFRHILGQKNQDYVKIRKRENFWKHTFLEAVYIADLLVQSEYS